MPTKYYQNISKGIKVIERTSFCLRTDRRTDRRTDGQTDRRTDARLIAISPILFGSGDNEVDANLKYEQENMEFKDLEGCFNDEHNKLFENSNTNVSIIPKDQWARFRNEVNLPGDMKDPGKDFYHYQHL